MPGVRETLRKNGRVNVIETHPVLHLFVAMEPVGRSVVLTERRLRIDDVHPTQVNPVTGRPCQAAKAVQAKPEVLAFVKHLERWDPHRAVQCTTHVPVKTERNGDVVGREQRSLLHVDLRRF